MVFQNFLMVSCKLCGFQIHSNFNFGNPLILAIDKIILKDLKKISIEAVVLLGKIQWNSFSFGILKSKINLFKKHRLKRPSLKSYTLLTNILIATLLRQLNVRLDKMMRAKRKTNHFKAAHNFILTACNFMFLYGSDCLFSVWYMHLSSAPPSRVTWSFAMAFAKRFVFATNRHDLAKQCTATAHPLNA